MRGKGAAIAGFAGIAVSVFFLVLSLSYGFQVCRLENTQLVSLNPQGVSANKAKMIQEEAGRKPESPALCFWRELELQPIQNEVLQRTSLANVSILCGSSDLLFPESSALLSGDTKGCLLGETLAYDLFGNKNAVGMQLSYGERVLTVREMLREEPESLVIQEEEKEGESQAAGVFSGLAVRTLENQRAHSILSELSSQYGIQSQPIAGGFYVLMAKLGGSLLFLAVSFLLFAKICVQLWENRRRPAVVLVFAGILLFWFWLSVRMAPYSVRIGKEALPSQWSDFSWFSARFEEIKDQLANLMKIEKRNALFFLLQNSWKAFGSGILSFMFFFMSRKKIETGQFSRLVGYSVLILLMIMGAALIVEWQGGKPENSLKGAGILLVYLWGVYGLKKWNSFCAD